jgi:hypothetical protein
MKKKNEANKNKVTLYSINYNDKNRMKLQSAMIEEKTLIDQWQGPLYS